MTFKPGKSGNPSGKRKEKLFATALRMELLEAGEDMPDLRKIARGLIDKAAGGDMQAVKEFADRLDGKVPQAIIGDGDEDPIDLVHRIEIVAASFGAPNDDKAG